MKNSQKVLNTEIIKQLLDQGLCACVCVCVCVYKMGSEAKRLTKEIKITAETYSKTETRVYEKIRVCKKIADEDYVMWVKMIDLKETFMSLKLMPCNNEKN